MARNRKRFYLALHANGTREILNLRYRPSAALLDTSSTTITRVVGPFHTFDDAAVALELPHRATLIAARRKVSILDRLAPAA